MQVREIACARDWGDAFDVERGIETGIEKGLKRGLLTAVLALAEVLDVDADRRAALDELEPA